MSRKRFLIASVMMVAVLATVFAPQGRLACAEPYVKETSPDGRWTITVCGRPMFLAMPGSGSDAPGWIVLRDETASIRGVSSLTMLQLYAGGWSSDTDWTPTRVSRFGVFDFTLRPGSGVAGRWLEDRIWRLRALLGLVAHDNA